MDKNATTLKGQCEDIRHATSFSEDVQVRVGTYSDIEEGDIVIIAAGYPGKGQSRLSLIDTNSKILLDIIAKIERTGKSVFILIVSNPVDILTRLAIEKSGLPSNQVFGSGTILDTSRLRILIAQQLEVVQSSVSAYVFGEHGDSSFAALSSATVSGVPISDMPKYDKLNKAGLIKQIRSSAYEIIAAKGATHYGIANAVVSIIAALGNRNKKLLSLGAYTRGEYGLDSVVLGLPVFINREGVEVFKNYPYSSSELESLHKSANLLDEFYQKHIAAIV